MGIDASIDGVIEPKPPEATPEELCEMRRKFADLCVKNRSVLGETKRECEAQENDFLKKLQALCKHGAVVSTAAIKEKRYFWGAVRQEGRTAKALCVLCGKWFDFGEYSIWTKQTVRQSSLVTNSFIHYEVSQDRFDECLKEWMYKSSVVMQVPIGIFK